MHEVVRALNRLQSDGVITQYAIGGAIGAAFYIEATQTEDVDAFVFLPSSATGLINLSPVYEALIQLGGVAEREYIRFADWPLQILTDANDLIREAILDAREVDFDQIPTRVFRAEHLCAIALQTGRSKDYLRVRMFLEQDAVNRNALQELLVRFRLTERAERLDGGL